jgi:hypothetical protein
MKRSVQLRNTPFALLIPALLFFCTTLRAQLAVPQLGVAHFPDGSVRAIRGLPANLMVGAREIASADSVSFSDAGGLISSAGVIRLLRTDGTVIGVYQSGELQPILNIESSLQTAVAWLPSKHALLHWDAGGFTVTPLNDASFGGTVSFVTLVSATSAQFFVLLADSTVTRVSVALPSGQLVSSEIQPGLHGSVFVQHLWLLSQSERGLTAQLPNGTRQSISLTQKSLPDDDLTIERMSTDWLHVFSQSTGTNWAVYLTAAKLNVSLLPPPVGEAVK